MEVQPCMCRDCASPHHSFHRHFLRAYCVPGTVLGTEDPAGTKTDKAPASQGNQQDKQNDDDLCLGDKQSRAEAETALGIRLVRGLARRWHLIKRMENSDSQTLE